MQISAQLSCFSPEMLTSVKGEMVFGKFLHRRSLKFFRSASFQPLCFLVADVCGFETFEVWLTCQIAHQLVKMADTETLNKKAVSTIELCSCHYLT